MRKVRKNRRRVAKLRKVPQRIQIRNLTTQTPPNSRMKI
jgi:hypothetical protein